MSRSFVPVALDLYTVRKDKGPAGDFWRAVQKQKPSQYQGVFIVSPEGKILATHGKLLEGAGWTREILATIKEANRAAGEVSVRPPTSRHALADRGLGVRKDGSIALAVYLRPMVLGLDRRGIGELAVDNVILTGDESSHFGMEGAKEGTAWMVPASVVRKLHKILSPVSDANTLPKAAGVTKASLRARVEAVIEGVAYVRYTGEIAGELVWEFDPHKGKKIRSQVVLRGVGAFDATTGKPQRIVLVGTGAYRSYPPYDEPSKYGAVVDWRLKKKK